MCMSGEANLGETDEEKSIEAECDAIVRENALMLAMVAKLGDVDVFDRVLAEVNGVVG
jgi:hypothetical protein